MRDEKWSSKSLRLQGGNKTKQDKLVCGFSVVIFSVTKSITKSSDVPLCPCYFQSSSPLYSESKKTV